MLDRLAEDLVLLILQNNRTLGMNVRLKTQLLGSFGQRGRLLNKFFRPLLQVLRWTAVASSSEQPGPPDKNNYAPRVFDACLTLFQTDF